MLGRLFERTRSSNNVNAQDAQLEARNMEAALRAVELVMNDNIPGAEEQLANGNSAFHQLARGTLGFMKATMGFEQDAMKEASDLLASAESTAASFHHRAQHDPHAHTSTIYDKGSEFALCQAEAQIMNAVVGVLNESLTESIKGFYKMRKAYLTLDSLAQQEVSYMKSKGIRSLASTRQNSSESIRSVKSFRSANSEKQHYFNLPITPMTATPTTPSALRHAQTPGDIEEDNGSDDEFVDANQFSSKHTSKAYEAHGATSGDTNDVGHQMHHLRISPEPETLPSGATTPTMVMPGHKLITADADSDLFSNSLDVFIHSGVNLMSGLINLMLSVIPPAFSRLLSIVGFRGERERGLRMLWQASKFPNINGGMAALVLFGWYNGIVGFCDIITDSDPNLPDDVNGFPRERLQNLLISMRVRYPDSFLWKLEEARAYSNQRQLSRALEILNGPEKAQMKQLEALHQFERSLDAMNSHQYKLCAETFVECVELNAWSQALYYYTAAAAYLQLYRDMKDDPAQKAEAEVYRGLAEKWFKHAPTCVGKKKMMGKSLPFDAFVVRKIAKWTDKSKTWGCSFIDAIGVAPIEETMMLWNGYKKQNEAQLTKSLANLEWSEKKNPHWEKEDFNEKSIIAVLRAIIFRNLRRHEESKEILRENILPYDASAYRGRYDDAWMGAAGHYEMAANLWQQRKEYTSRYGTSISGIGIDSGHMTDADIQSDAKLIAEAKIYITKAKAWPTYELDTRIGMKVTAGLGAINKWEAKHGIA